MVGLGASSLYYRMDEGVFDPSLTATNHRAWALATDVNIGAEISNNTIFWGFLNIVIV